MCDAVRYNTIRFCVCFSVTMTTVNECIHVLCGKFHENQLKLITAGRTCARAVGKSTPEQTLEFFFETITDAENPSNISAYHCQWLLNFSDLA